MEVLRYLHQGFGLTAHDARACSALKCSVREGHLAVVQYLCEGFNLSKADAHKAHALAGAHPSIAEYLVAWVARGKFDPNWR